MKRATTVLALAASIAIVVSACGSGGGGGGSGPSGGGGGGGSGGGVAADRTIPGSDQDFLAFTRCVRAHHVTISDPVHRAGHTGLTLELPSPTAAALSAESACRHYIQPVIDMKAAGARTLTARIRLPLIRYAECMRTHGIPLQDPTPEGVLNLGGGPAGAGAPGRYSAQFRAADHHCRRLLPRSVADSGTGP